MTYIDKRIGGDELVEKVNGRIKDKVPAFGPNMESRVTKSTIELMDQINLQRGRELSQADLTKQQANRRRKERRRTRFFETGMQFFHRMKIFEEQEHQDNSNFNPEWNRILTLEKVEMTTYAEPWLRKIFDTHEDADAEKPFQSKVMQACTCSRQTI